MSSRTQPLSGTIYIQNYMEPFNYFNYFTEIEEHFWRKRGAHLLVSPLDWAIVETWQKAGIPLEAVLKGIDRAFESWGRSKRAAGGRQLKSLAYCVDAVLDAAAEAQESAVGTGPEIARSRPQTEPFSRDELRKYLERNAARLRAAAAKLRQNGAEPSPMSGNATSAAPPPNGGSTNPAALSARLEEIVTRIGELLPLFDSPGPLDLEDLERRLTVLEDKLTAALSADADENLLLNIRREMDTSLAPYRRKMSAEQLTQLERQYTQKRLFEHFSLPRLSLFYLT
jgi:hypothetical protein